MLFCRAVQDYSITVTKVISLANSFLRIKTLYIPRNLNSVEMKIWLLDFFFEGIPQFN